MESVDKPQRTLIAVACVYLAGFLQGLTLVSFPASSAVLKQTYAFTDAQYGAIFLPQVALAVVGALAGGFLAQRVGLQRLLWIALLGNALSQIALAGVTVLEPGMAYAVTLVGTACMGFGFGLSGAPLNSYPPIFFPRQRNTAVVALHTALGVGLMVGPLLASSFIHADNWVGFPVLLLGLCLAIAAMSAVIRLPRAGTAPPPEAQTSTGDRPVSAPAFWLFVLIAVLYAFAEGTFSNWIVIYLQEVKRLPEMTAALALSVFWGALVAGRLLVSVLVLRIAAERIWMTLPALMICAFLLLPYARNPALGTALFALAGLACSAFFPLTIALSSRMFPDHVAWVSSMMIAALMIGVGMGSFVIGPLRNLLPLEQLYQASSLYPLAALVLSWGLLRMHARTALRARAA